MLISRPGAGPGKDEDNGDGSIAREFECSRVRRVVTGYTVHTGSNDKFSGGWDRIFGKKKKASASKSEKTAGKSQSKSKKK
ncbi:MAG: hypothetical protein DWQ34_19300 [Planctomycetota bacterium]|nr:MAG: hypothetical protein DWQ34_19300 [Planctomycetota bacterium]REJ92350.1 MAG: hypothetical protein DWQ29_04895 [Planctomycetota bacterium]REK24379.1 MAG: hypothetical protein DWQ41_15270 [Planctomycetota bacterium]REK38570.1 MAG: hypothetical protein DWQ45_04065 [Planctomycetota bacterium]